MRVDSFWLRLAALAVGTLLCAGCAGPASETPAAQPSPTLAVSLATPAQLVPTPTPPITVPSSPPTSLPTATPAQMAPSPSSAPAAQPTVTAPAAFEYVWPQYLPDGMQISPDESRVAREGEYGDDNLGFFIVTFNSPTAGKLVIGGGSTETLPLDGEVRPVTIGGRSGTLTVKADQRQIRFNVSTGSLFVYSSQLGEDELLKVAGSLQPTDVQALRERIGAQ